MAQDPEDYRFESTFPFARVSFWGHAHMSQIGEPCLDGVGHQSPVPILEKQFCQPLSFKSAGEKQGTGRWRSVLEAAVVQVTPRKERNQLLSGEQVTF